MKFSIRAMSRVMTGLVTMALAATFMSCTTKIEMKPTSISMGGGIDDKTGKLIDAGEEFKSTDTEAVAWAEFQNAYGKHTARFRWFNEREQLVLDSGPIPVTDDDMLYAWRRVWSTLPIKNSPAQLMPGDWTVKVYFDGEKIETLEFEIEEDRK